MKASLSSRQATSSLSARQLADSIPVHDEEDHKAAGSSKTSFQDAANTPETFTMQREKGPIAMSIPAILRQNVPGFKAKNARVAELQPSGGRRGAQDDADGSHGRTGPKLGRRKQRRWENGAHAFPATKRWRPKWIR